MLGGGGGGRAGRRSVAVLSVRGGGRGMHNTADHETYIYIRTGALLTGSCCRRDSFVCCEKVDRNQLIE